MPTNTLMEGKNHVIMLLWVAAYVEVLFPASLLSRTSSIDTHVSYHMCVQPGDECSASRLMAKLLTSG